MEKIFLTYVPLAIAFLAVFVGPIISYFIMKKQIENSQNVSKRQIESSLKIANKQIIAPMRQKWIDNLRELISEFQSSTLHYYVAGFENRTDDEYRRIEYLEEKMKLTLNPLEDDHKELIELVNKSKNILSSSDKANEMSFPDNHTKITHTSQKILKREWNRVKDEL